ncbi:SAM-dependent methyltransferase [Nocardiopsis trehalosi]|uniref:SAM-dependent methyltransferase n=1 Tax=Nocardiopsis trehalosi TaxID=109329 RepID=UPI000832E696|nr:SAM-dependent methyltransferase [Nocardiopsis trehalosi]
MADPPPDPAPRIDTTVPHNARIWNYWLGGTDHHPVDREMGERIRALFPEIADNARADRDFLARAVRHLVTACGVRQFLDVGAGLPTRDNTHEVAQRLAPDARVVYVDNDASVLAHARALLTGTAEGATAYLHADLRDPDRILAGAARTLDLDRPVGLMLLGVTAFVDDDAEVHRAVDTLLGALAPGSHLVVSHPTDALDPVRAREVRDAWNARGTPKLTLRGPDRIAALFRGNRLLDPGVVSCSLWRPDHPGATGVRPVDEYGGVGRLP